MKILVSINLIYLILFLAGSFLWYFFGYSRGYKHGRKDNLSYGDE